MHLFVPAEAYVKGNDLVYWPRHGVCRLKNIKVRYITCDGANNHLNVLSSPVTGRGNGQSLLSIHRDG